MEAEQPSLTQVNYAAVTFGILLRLDIWLILDKIR